MFQVKDIAGLLQTAPTGDEFLSSKVDPCSDCVVVDLRASIELLIQISSDSIIIDQQKKPPIKYPLKLGSFGD